MRNPSTAEGNIGRSELNLNVLQLKNYRPLSQIKDRIWKGVLLAPLRSSPLLNIQIHQNSQRIKWVGE